MYLLGISAYYHDAAAALIKDGKILAAAEEERFTRIKHDASFPINAARWCLQYAEVDVNDVAAVAFYDKPLLKFERLLETYYAVAPKGYFSFLKSIPVWINDKLLFRSNIYKQLRAIGLRDKEQLKLLFPEHHLSHASSAFYPSPFTKAAILTIDGVGEWCTTSIALGEDRHITTLQEMHFPDSVGLLYSAFTYYLGFKVNSGEYKLMGLAPYGNAGATQTKEYIDIIWNQLCTVYEDGSVCLNQKVFSYAYSLRMLDDKKMAKLFGFERRKIEAPIEQQHCNLALAVQTVTEDIVLRLAKHAQQLTGCEALCMAGGVALNSVANGKMHESGLFKDLYIQPAAGDDGGAVGAALAAYHLYFEKEREAAKSNDDIMNGAFLGPSFNNKEVEQRLASFQPVYTRFKSFSDLANCAASLLEAGNVLGWFQDRMEFGPRALGNRSILADPRKEEMQQKLNLKIKYREGFRPFAPAVLAEDVQHYFEFQDQSPYMLLVKPVKELWREPLPANYIELDLWEKLYCKRSLLPAVTHVDFSARIQTVSSKTNPRFHSLLTAFREKTGIPVLVNTSFNVRGEPIVCTPEEAYRCFMLTEMDFLVINDFLFKKDEQPKWRESKTTRYTD